MELVWVCFIKYLVLVVIRSRYISGSSFSADTAIRIDDVNPAGVYFFTHTLTTYRRLHDMYSATFKRKPNVGVGHGLPKHSSL